MPELSQHARDRMAQRGVTFDDVVSVVNRPLRGPLPGDGGNLVFEGYTQGARLLRVITTSDRSLVVSVMWRG